MPYFWKIDPYTEAWWAARRGIPTASQFHRIITETGNPCRADTTRTYMCKLIAERILGETIDDKRVSSPWVEHGHRTESTALMALSRSKNLILLDASLVTDREHNPRYGCTPDAFVEGSVEAVEVKCPAPWTQIQYLLDGPGTDYKAQVQGHLYVGGWQRVHFYSYHPRMPEVHIVFERDIAYLAKLHSLLNKFCDKLEEDTERAREFGPYVAMAAYLAAQEAERRAEGYG